VGLSGGSCWLEVWVRSLRGNDKVMMLSGGVGVRGVGVRYDKGIQTGAALLRWGALILVLDGVKEEVES